jgi:hypothetical protein
MNFVKEGEKTKASGHNPVRIPAGRIGWRKNRYTIAA